MSATDWSSAAALLRCPLCAGSFRALGAALRCEWGHSFDVAREGYVNLLATGRAAPKLAGDSREMLRARRAFLERGHYQPLSDAINALVASHLARGSRTAPVAVLDAGCGEGYYLGQLSAHLSAHATDIATGVAPAFFGMDIARAAVRLAAGRNPLARFVVADVTMRWPFADASMAVALDIFAPRNPAESARVLAAGALLLVVIPTPVHLAELRQLLPLLAIEPEKQERVIERLGGAFALASASTLEYPLELSGADAALLPRMTPSARHIAPEAPATLATRERVSVTASFALLAFTRRE